MTRRPAKTVAAPAVVSDAGQPVRGDAPATDVPSVATTFRAVLSVEGVLIPAVLLGALAYMLGWRFLRDYYVTLGLDLTLLSFSVIDVVAAGRASISSRPA